MNAKRLALTGLFTGLLGLSTTGGAADIDIYSSSASGGTMTPNMIFVIDSSSNSDSNFSSTNCAYYDGTSPTITPTAPSQILGNEQCALVNIVHSLPTRTVTDPTTGATSQVAYINLGVTTAAGLLMPLTPIDDNTYSGPSTVGLTTIPAGTTNRMAFILAVKNGYAKQTGVVDQGKEMQETWAYYTGGNQGVSGVANNKGSITGTVFAAGAGAATTGCMSNYITFIGSSANSAHALASDGTSPLDLLTAINNDKVNNVITATVATALSTTFPATIDPENPWGMEWARFMYATDANPTGAGSQKITTYTVNLVPPSPPSPSTTMPVYWQNMAKYGGGKSFSAADYATLVSSILKIINEVQAVNSVFSSSSLPVSVNAQGTYLNQIFMGMFRPDASANPRWLGNLKQYQFIYSTSNGLQLGDSVGAAAISGAGTGFIGANAISFWTCTNLGTYGTILDPYVTSGLLTSTQKTTLMGNHQDCPDTSAYPNLLINGFYAADPSSPGNGALGFELPDGEKVERGGAAENIRQANLINDYSTAAGTSTNSRRVYTWLGTNVALTDPSNAFALSNAGITSAMLGASMPISVSSLARCLSLAVTGCTVVNPTIAIVTTAIPHGFPVGTPLTVTITGAAQPEYNVTQTVTPTSTTQFTITGLPDNPPTPATGTYTVSVHGANVPQAISSGSMSVSTSATANSLGCAAAAANIPNFNCDLVTVNLTAHGYSTNDQVAIAGVSPAQYDGTFTITVTNANQFTYTVPVTPTSPSINAYQVTPPAVSASIASISAGNGVNKTTITANNSFVTGQTITISGSTTGNNGTFTVGTTSSTSFTITNNSSVTCTSTCGTVTLVAPVMSLASGCISRASGTATKATVSVSATCATYNGSNTFANFTNGESINISYVSGTGVNESAYAPNPSGNNGVTITCTPTSGTNAACMGTSFTFPITTLPSSTTLTLSSATATKAGTPASITGITRAGTTATASGVGANSFVVGSNLVDILSSNAPPNESAYLSPTGGTTMTCAAAGCSSFTFPVALSPATPATGSIKVYSGSTPPDRTTLINWMRGDDDVGDENSVCPNGKTPGTSPCPNPAVTIRPSVHGDVLHARPTVLNYGFHTITITGTTDSGSVRTATASAADVSTVGLSGAAPIVTFSTGDACVVTITSATTFTYQNTLCGMSGPQTASTGSKVVVYYGDNGGVFHAINGNLAEFNGAAGPGDELWGFIPAEFFGKLSRLMSNSPQILMPSTPPGITPTPAPKDYFVDGEPGIYQLIDANGNTTKAVIYMAMRRGGNFIYALDVTTPTSPLVQWKIDPSGFTNVAGFTAEPDFNEMGQTWSQPRVTKVVGYCNTAALATPLPCSATNPPSPVMIFGAGYDTNEDNEPMTAMDSFGRGIFVVDALTGAKVWSATHSAGVTSYSGTTTKATALIAGMNYAIPSSITMVDRDNDGYTDRLYAVDLGGNLWRVDLEPAGGSTPDQWRVYKVAALGGWTGPCGSTPCTPTQRKFFYPPEVITATTKYNFDSIVLGSGDREHPLYVSSGTQRYNRLFMVVDPSTSNDASTVTTYPVTLGGTNPLDDCTGGTCVLPSGTSTGLQWCQLSPLNRYNGYFITLGAAEKVVNAPLVAAGFAYMSTNQPSSPSANSCTANLGTAYGYQLAPFCGTVQRVTFAGGGLPPSPVAGVVDIAVNGVVQHMPFLIGGGNPKCTGSAADCTSAFGGQRPPINVPTNRQRTYWYIQDK